MTKPLATFAAFTTFAALLFAAAPAHALIYPADNSLESLLVRAPLVVIATVTATRPADDTAVIKVDKTLKGHTAESLTVKNIQLRISLKEKKPRFAAGETVVLFLATPKDSAPAILYGRTLATDADRKAMADCIAQILPVAQPLADLHLPHKAIDKEALHNALAKLIVSKNAFTQILVGRLMATALPDRVPPDDNLLFMALLSPRLELKKGALIWAQKYKVLPPRILLLVKEIAGDPDQKSLAKLAEDTLKKTAP